MVKILYARDGSMKLESNAAGWCQVFIQIGENQAWLGADRSEIIEARLAAGLADDLTGPTAGSIDGSEVRYVLALAEQHGTIYAAHQGEVRRLFFQGPDGALIGKLDVLEHERRAWLENLTRR